LEKINREKRKEVSGFSTEVLEFFFAHSWPGNVRELENVIEHAVIVAKQDKLLPKDLPQSLLLQRPLPEEQAASLRDFERGLILKTLEETRWNKHQTAKRLKINRSSLYGKIKRYGLMRE
jgi:two-component system response regulator HydG